MSKPVEALPAHPLGEQSSVEFLPEEVGLCADTFGGRVHVEWDPTAAATPFGQLPFFVEFLKLGGLFDPWVADCPLTLMSPNAPAKRDILGTLLLAILAGHQRYAHITALRGDTVNAALLGMRRVMSEDSVRRALAKIDEAAGVEWLQRHLDYTFRPLLGEPWILDVDTTVKPLYGRQEGAVVGYNPHKPGRPSHTYHTYAIAELRLMPEVEVPGGQPACLKTFGTGLVGVAGAARPRGVAAAAARRLRLGHRGEHEPGGTGGIALPVQAAADPERQAADRAGDGRAGLARCRPWLAGQAVDVAAGRPESTPAGDPAATADRTDGGDGDG
jgi:hypothetical protein